MLELSVVIATYNRAGPLRATLDTLFRQTLPADQYEVIVVADGATDDTVSMLGALRAEGAPCALRPIWQENAGPGAARNRGASAAAGRVLVFLDDDIRVEPGLLEAHLEAQRRAGPRGCVGLGHLSFSLPQGANGFARYLGEWWQEHYARLASGSRPAGATDCFSGNLSVLRDEFLAIGGFTADLRRDEDTELGYRLERHGLPFVYVQSAVGHQDYQKGFDQIAADAEREGEAALTLYERHPPLLARLPLGAFGRSSHRAVLLRRLLLTFDVPPQQLRWAGPLLTRLAGRRAATEWYRFLQSYCYWRGVRRRVRQHTTRQLWTRLTRGVPVLMYHAFGRDDEPPSAYVVPARRFAQQMALLRWLRYRPITLDQYVRCLREYQLPPARAVVISIDDGYADNVERALPILRRHGFPATLFLVSGRVGSANDWDSAGPLAGRKLVSWPMVAALRASGVEIGAHTRTHAALTTLDPAQAQDEIAGSKEDLEKQIGAPVTTFAYPYGKCDPAVEQMAADAGFLGACSIRRGLNNPSDAPYSLRRTTVHGTDNLARFLLGLWLGDTRLIYPKNTP